MALARRAVKATQGGGVQFVVQMDPAGRRQRHARCGFPGGLQGNRMIGVGEWYGARWCVPGGRIQIKMISGYMHDDMVDLLQAGICDRVFGGRHRKGVI